MGRRTKCPHDSDKAPITPRMIIPNVPTGETENVPAGRFGNHAIFSICFSSGKLHVPAALWKVGEYEQARLTGQHCSCPAILKCIRRCNTFSASHHHSRHHPVDPDIQHLSRLIWSTTSQAIHTSREILHACITYFVCEEVWVEARKWLCSNP
jgi:hypothetical protein